MTVADITYRVDRICVLFPSSDAVEDKMFSSIIFILTFILIYKCVLVVGEFSIGVISMALTKVTGTK